MKRKYLWSAIVAIIVAILMSGCSDGYGGGGCDWATGWCEGPEDYYYEEDEPYTGYNDSYDQDCEDVGEEVWVGSDDPDGLDADGDGYGCETYP